ncbi:MAG: hypothetical protein CBB70_07800 [Planctomycetaceae bacterium TMED10]|nr:MAG: hypothetical protein CBB70_07800 [Planctomycetaceae bacterium TMED10]
MNEKTHRPTNQPFLNTWFAPTRVQLRSRFDTAVLINCGQFLGEICGICGVGQAARHRKINP